MTQFKERACHVSLSRFSSPEQKAHSELIVYQSIRRLCVCVSICLCVNIFKHEYLRNQWADCKFFYLKHHLGGGKAAISFWPDQIGTLVSMATDSSHGVIIAKT